MMNFLKRILLRLLLRPAESESKIPVNTYHKSIKRGQFTFDTYWLDLYDSETKRRYVVRPTGNPVPFIIDELVKITGNMKSAVEVYSKFTQASAAVTKKGTSAFKAKIFN